MSLDFASGILGCFLFEPEVPGFFTDRTDNNGGRAPDRSRARLETRRTPAHAEEGVEHGDTGGGF